ncbi:MAG: zinc-dependent metalloprotease [Acidimicrobiales bacterium]
MDPIDDATATDPVAWNVALRIVNEIARFQSPLEPAARRALDEDFEEATTQAERIVEEVTGLHSAFGPTRSVVIDRAGWGEANIGSLRRLLAPVGRKLAEQDSSQRRALSPAAKAAAGVEIGALLGWMSSRVLGQYDLMPNDADATGGLVYFVGPNVVSLERRFGFDPRQFRLWLALHEVTHRLQFTGVPWMRAHFVGLVERGTTSGLPDIREVIAGLRRAAAQFWEGINPLADGGVVGLIASSEQLATLRDAQALMSLLEGHAEAVMSRAGTEAIPDARRFAEVLAERRASARGVVKFAQQALGIEAKLRQYADGSRFIAAVEKAGGPELFAKVWESPEWLPSLEEIRSPERWIARASGVSSPSG